MAKTFRKLIFRLITFLIIISSFLGGTPFGYAAGSEDGLSLSITPPLFQLDIGSGEFWSSTLKIVNINSYDLTVYASVVDFESTGEEGKGKFTPVLNDSQSGPLSLAQWISITKDQIIIPKEKSVDVPFTVQVPENVEPGGHYAAILIGTQSLDAEQTKGPVLQVSTFVSSLLFVRIKGDVREEGMIREFSTEKQFYQEPNVKIALRFENTGNVHLKPQGEIVIYNMQGKIKQKIPVNEGKDFGNILPQSVRKFDYTWEGDEDTFEIGRYKSVVTLSYGSESHKNISQETYFWIIPLKPVLTALGILVFLSLIIILMIRLYIKKTIKNLQPLAKPKIKKIGKLKIKKTRNQVSNPEAPAQRENKKIKKQ